MLINITNIIMQNKNISRSFI